MQQTERLNVTGMTCAGCVSKVTQALKAMAGVGEVSVSLANHEATVRYDEKKTAPDKLAGAIVAAGYGVGAPDVAHPQSVKRACC